MEIIQSQKNKKLLKIMVICLGLIKNIKIPCIGDVMKTCVNRVLI